MIISKISDHELKATWNHSESRIIGASIIQTRGWLQPSEILSNIGVSAAYLQTVFHHDVAVSRSRPEKPSKEHLTLNIVKVNNDEYHATMSPKDMQMLANCLKAAMNTTSHRELSAIYDIKGEEFQSLLDQIEEAQRHLFAGGTP